MKRFLYISFLILGTITNSNAQCSEILITYGKTQIGDASYICDYKVVLDKSKKRKPAFANYKIKLEKDNLYRFTTVNDLANENPLIAKISDDYNVYAISFDDSKNKDKGGFDFLCKKTQNYYLTCFYKDGTEGCGAVLFSFVKTYSKY